MLIRVDQEARRLSRCFEAAGLPPELLISCEFRDSRRDACPSRRSSQFRSATIRLERIVDLVNVERFLPLTPVVLEIAMALAAGERHGYDIMQDVERRTEGRIVLHPGTLYRALARLLDQKLIEELGERRDDDDERRRYYRLTPLGRAVARAEVERLAGQVSAARRLFRGGGA